MLRAAVIGAGNMGRHHIRVLSALPEVELVAIVDRDLESASRASRGRATSLLADMGELPDVDAAVVAVPTGEHAPVASALLSRGIAVLVEKPIAGTPEEGAALVEAARRAGVVLAVGHIERFNPAVNALARIVHEPLLMQFERLSPYSPRTPDSVVFDLMVHDLDLALMLAGDEPTRVEAAGVTVFGETLDAATAVVQLGSGCIATLSASRITQDKVRRICISERERFIVADCLRQDVSVKRETLSEFLEDAGATYRQASVIEIPYLDRRAEPLELELRDFLGAVRGEHAPAVGGDVALRALDLACRVEAAAVGA